MSRAPGAWVAGLLLLLAGGWGTPLDAAEVPALYETRVSVADRSESARREALVPALRQVLVKVSGRDAEQWGEVLDPVVEDPVRYLGQYRYEEVRPDTAPEAPSAEPAEPRLFLWASFDAAAVNELARRLGLPVWGRLRPSVLVWVGLEQDGGRRLLGGAEEEDFLSALGDRARERGIPVVFPLLDLEDQTALGVSDLWGGFGERILAASERYRSEVVLAGRVYPVLDEVWEGSWSLFIDGDQRRWTGRGESVAMVLARAMNTAADRLAQRYARAGVAVERGGLELTVGGLFGVSDFARVSDYLNRVDGIEGVTLVGLEGDRATFRVDSGVAGDLVRRQLTVGGVLSAMGGGGEWVYELRR